LLQFVSHEFFQLLFAIFAGVYIFVRCCLQYVEELLLLQMLLVYVVGDIIVAIGVGDIIV